jgi:hypothetical protein
MRALAVGISSSDTVKLVQLARSGLVPTSRILGIYGAGWQPEGSRFQLRKRNRALDRWPQAGRPSAAPEICPAEVEIG